MDNGQALALRGTLRFEQFITDPGLASGAEFVALPEGLSL